MSFNFDFIGGHLPQHPGGSSIYTGFGLNSQHPPMSTFKDNIFKDDLYLSDEDENGRKMPVRLPLFGRCPLTNKAYLDLGLQNAANKAQQQSLSLRTQENDGVTAKQSRVMGDISNLTNRSQSRCSSSLLNPCQTSAWETFQEISTEGFGWPRKARACPCWTKEKWTPFTEV